MCTCVCMFMYVCMCVYVCIYVCMCVHVRVCVCVCVRTWWPTCRAVCTDSILTLKQSAVRKSSVVSMHSTSRRAHPNVLCRDWGPELTWGGRGGIPINYIILN